MIHCNFLFVCCCCYFAVFKSRQWPKSVLQTPGGAVKYEVDTDVRPALQQAGAFGESTGSKNEGSLGESMIFGIQWEKNTKICGVIGWEPKVFSILDCKITKVKYIVFFSNASFSNHGALSDRLNEKNMGLWVRAHATVKNMGSMGDSDAEKGGLLSLTYASPPEWDCPPPPGTDPETWIYHDLCGLCKSSEQEIPNWFLSRTTSTSHRSLCSVSRFAPDPMSGCSLSKPKLSQWQRLHWSFPLKFKTTNLKGHWTTSASSPNFFKKVEIFTSLEVYTYVVTAC